MRGARSSSTTPASMGAPPGVFDGPLTFPSDAPNRQIDYIFAPASWELLEHRVIQTDVSDHLPIISRFRVNP